MFSVAPLASLRVNLVWPRTTVITYQPISHPRKQIKLPTSSILAHRIFQLVDHPYEETIYGLVVWAEDAQRMVALRSEQQDCDFLLSWGLEGCILIEDLGGGFLEYGVLEIWVGLESFADEDHVDHVDGEEDDCGCQRILLRENEDQKNLDASTNEETGAEFEVCLDSLRQLSDSVWWKLEEYILRRVP